MTTFTKVQTSTRIVNQITKEVVLVNKYRKEGTERYFYSPCVDDHRITSTMFSRLAEAEKLAKMFLNRNQAQR